MWRGSSRGVPSAHLGGRRRSITRELDKLFYFQCISTFGLINKSESFFINKSAEVGPNIRLFKLLTG